MSAVDTQARQVSDFLAELLRQSEALLKAVELAIEDRVLCDVEVELLTVRIDMTRPVITDGNLHMRQAANELAGAIEGARRLLNVGLIEFIDPHTQAKLADIVEERERRRQKEEDGQLRKAA